MRKTVAAHKRQREKAEIKDREEDTEPGGEKSEKKQGKMAQQAQVSKVRTSLLHRCYFKTPFSPNLLTADYTHQDLTAPWTANLYHSSHLYRV